MRRSIFSGSAVLALAAAGSAFPMTALERSRGRYMRGPEGHPAPRDPEVIAKELGDKVKAATDEVKALAEKAVSDVAQFGKMTTEAKEEVDKALSKMGGFATQLQEFEQAVDRLKNAGFSGEEAKSLGEQFVESDQFKKLADGEHSGQRGRATLDLKSAMPDLETKATITLSTANAAGSAGSLVQPTRLPQVLQIPQRRMTIRDLISPGQMAGNALQYVRQTGFTNNAGMVAETQRKPQSDLQLSLVDTTAKVIAHYMKASRQVLDDAPMLRSLIDSHLLYGLAFREEAQILYGDGTGQNLLGIVPQATDYDASREAAVLAQRGAGAAISAIDRIRLAMLQSVLAEFPATGPVLNPIDWAIIELFQDAMGRYVIGQPQGQADMRLWRLPVAETAAMTAGQFLTGAFRLGAQLFDRWTARVQLSTENEDDFVNNLVTILAEERIALAVYRPEAFITGDLYPAVGP